jgi:hypothetical protein
VGRIGSFAALNLVDVSTFIPMDDAARKEVAVTQRVFAAEQRALANVIEGDGFMGSTARSVAAGVALLSRVPFQQRVFESPGPACAWLAGFFPGEPVGAADLEQAVAALRGRS